MSDRELQKRMAAEHASLRADQRRLTEALDEQRRTPTDATRTALCEQFHAFADRLRNHMAYEETGGYLSSVSERKPNSSDEVDRLRAEHDSIRESLSALHDDLERFLVEKTGFDADCVEAIVDLQSRLADHERAEHELLMDTFWTDGGRSR